MAYISAFYTSPIAKLALERLFGIGISSSSSRALQPLTTSTTTQDAAPLSAIAKSAASKIDAALLAIADLTAQPTASPTRAAIAAYTSTDGSAPRASTPGGPISAAGGEFSVDYVIAASWGRMVAPLRDAIKSVRLHQEILSRSVEDQVAITRAGMERLYGKDRADAWAADDAQIQTSVARAKEGASVVIQEMTPWIDKYIDQLKSRFRVDGDFTTTDETGLIGLGSFSLTYESSREIGHLSVGPHWMLGTTEIDYTITRKDTGEVRRGDILNYKITR